MTPVRWHGQGAASMLGMSAAQLLSLQASLVRCMLKMGHLANIPESCLMIVDVIAMQALPCSIFLVRSLVMAA